MSSSFYVLLLISINPLLIESACKYKNPLFHFTSPDPWIIHHHGYYYYCRSAGDSIHIHRSSNLSNWANSLEKTVWSAPSGKPYSHEVWAPELHFLQGKWYIYFAADEGNNPNHRMYVLQSNNDADPMAGFHFKGQLIANPDHWAIDGTVLEHNHKLYFIWSGWDHPNAGFPQNLYISEMESPIKIKPSSHRVLIGEPIHSWEKLGFDPREKHPGLLEGPEVLISPKSGKVFLTFSASGSWSRFYKIGALVLNGNDPLNAKHWHHHEHPLMEEYVPNKVYGTGHASFTHSKDGKESYIIYHAMADPNAGWGGRTARLQKFHWDQNTDFPVFGHPASLETSLPSPSGEC